MDSLAPEKWLGSQQFAMVEGLRLRPLSHPRLATMLYAVSKGQATVVYTLDSDSKRWILKKFHSNRKPVRDYLLRIRGLVPRNPSFTCGHERTMLVSASLSHADGCYYSDDLALWLEDVVLMPCVSGDPWSEVADDLREGTLAFTTQQRLFWCKHLVEMNRLLESSGIAHRDLSVTNLFLNSREDRIELIDWDSMFHSELKMPENTTYGTDGYIAPLVQRRAEKTWCMGADRFAMAVLIAEFLTVTKGDRIAADGGMFEQDDFELPNEHVLEIAFARLRQTWPPAVELLQQALGAGAFDEMPTWREWETALEGPLRIALRREPFARIRESDSRSESRIRMIGRMSVAQVGLLIAGIVLLACVTVIAYQCGRVAPAETAGSFQLPIPNPPYKSQGAYKPVEPRWAEVPAYLPISEARAPIGEIDVIKQAKLVAAKDHFERGERFQLVGSLYEAFLEYKIAFGIRPYPELVFDAAQVCELMGERAEALDHYQRFLSLRPSGAATVIATERIDALRHTPQLCLPEWGVFSDLTDLLPAPFQIMDMWGSRGGAMIVVAMHLHDQQNAKGEGVILRLSEAGGHWRIVRKESGRLLFSVGGDEINGLYVVGDEGVILHSEDGGQHWLDQDSGTKATLMSVWAAGNGETYVVGEDQAAGAKRTHAVILHSTGQQRRWEPLLAPPSGNGLRRIWGTGPEDIWIVGWGGTILHSTSGIGGFVVLVPDVFGAKAGPSLFDVWGSGPSDVYVVGAGGLVLHTGNGGRTWSSWQTGGNAPLIAVGGAREADVVAGGRGGSVVRYEGRQWHPAVLGLGVEKINRIIGAGDMLFMAGAPSRILCRSTLFAK